MPAVSRHVGGLDCMHGHWLWCMHGHWLWWVGGKGRKQKVPHHLKALGQYISGIPVTKFEHGVHGASKCRRTEI